MSASVEKLIAARDLLARPGMRPRKFTPAPILTHFVLTDYGPGSGQVFDETPHDRSFDDVVEDIATGQFTDVRIVFRADQADGSLSDVTSDVADALARRDWSRLSPVAQGLCERFGVAPDLADDDPRSPGEEHGTHSLWEVA